MITVRSAAHKGDTSRRQFVTHANLPRVGAAPSQHIQRKAGHCACGGGCPRCQTALPIQAKLVMSQPGDPYEQEADRVAEQVMRMPEPVSVSRKASGGAGTEAPVSVGSVLGSSGEPLPASTRAFFEPRFGMDLSHVRVHTDGNAQQSARDVNALAYTVGSHVVFGAGQYDSGTSGTQRLLAHELAHVMQQVSAKGESHSPKTAMQRQIASGPLLRQDVVYVMGRDAFYIAATRFFRARFPNATFVTSVRNLHDLLNHLNSNFTSPLGNIFIVSHANEDGTLSFGLNRGDRDHRLTAVELRNALNPSSGTSGLPSIAPLVDHQTRIRIKGCDLGRNQQIVELFDQAFGGEGVVTAPTHEQGYSYNTGEIRAATTAAMTQHLQEFEEGLEPIPDAPEPVDRSLRGQERHDATRAFREATAERRRVQARRRAAIVAERRRFSREASRIGEEEGTHEYLSGPMFQRPGTLLFEQSEIRTEVDRLYPHLSVVQRENLVNRLIAPDRRAASIAQRQGPFQQQGQRAYRYDARFTYVDPVTADQINAAFWQHFRRNHFVMDSFTMTSNAVGTATIRHYEIVGHDSRRGRQDRTLTLRASSAPVETDDVLLQQVRAQVNNPDKYNWRIEANRSANGILTKTVVRERVVAYLHHGSLDAAPSQRFTRPESDRRFYAESTFTPPPSSGP